MSELPGYLAILLMGMTLGVIGAGGSILTVPILVYLFGVNPTLATARVKSTQCCPPGCNA